MVGIVEGVVSTMSETWVTEELTQEGKKRRARESNIFQQEVQKHKRRRKADNSRSSLVHAAADRRCGLRQKQVLTT